MSVQRFSFTVVFTAFKFQVFVLDHTLINLNCHFHHSAQAKFDIYCCDFVSLSRTCFSPLAEQEEEEVRLHPVQRFRSDVVAEGEPGYDSYS